MPIDAGQRLLHYRLTEKIGEGGMGVVWRATDTELGRDVAIKVLPDTFAADAQRLARFEREAKLLASLNHPNVAGVYGLHRDSGVRFLAMEYVEGEDLAARLQRGALPSDEALEIAKQIADGLELAHGNDVIHRDLKPANIRLTPGGTAKILDFGLAKALGPEASSAVSDSMQSPTVTSFGTVAGVILGTASYMSPEQAKGRAVDRRADVWAFGCVLFEMLTGRRPFGGETVTDTLAAVVRAEPDWEALPAAVPARVRQLLRRCLQKDPRARLRDVGDAGLELLDAQAGIALASDSGGATARSRLSTWLPWALVAMLTIVLLTFVARTTPPEPASRGKRQFPIQVSDGLRHWAPAISRDGRRLASVVASSGLDEIGELRVWHLDTGEVRKLDTGGFNPESLFFSPDGSWVGFKSGDKLMKARVAGGPPVEIADTALITWAPDWREDDTIVFASWGRGLSLVPASGGETRALTVLDPERGETGGYGVGAHESPAWSPDGQAVLLRTAAGIERVDVTTRERELLLDVPAQSIGVAPGWLLWVEASSDSAGALFGVELEDDGRIVRPSPIMIAEESAAFAVSDEGTLALASSYFAPRVAVWVDRAGNETSIPGIPHPLVWPRISPDGARIAGHWPNQLHVHDFERDVTTTLLPDQENEVIGVWSPDGQDLYFMSRSPQGGVTGYRVAADGSGEPVELFPDEERIVLDVSKDGRVVLSATPVDFDAGLSMELWIRAGDDEPRKVTTNTQVFASLSPDGRRIAYSSGPVHEMDVYVMDIETEQRWKVGPGRHPKWSPDGTELFFRRGQALVAVPVAAGGPGRAETLFSIPSPVSLYDHFYDVHPDGERFFMYRWAPDAETSPSNRFTVVLDWMEAATK